jgi:hypothetical protein
MFEASSSIMKRTKLELRPAKPLPSLTIGADWPSLADPRRGGPQCAFWPFDWGMSDKTAYRIMAQRQGRQGLRQGLASMYGYAVHTVSEGASRQTYLPDGNSLVKYLLHHGS